MGSKPSVARAQAQIRYEIQQEVKRYAYDLARYWKAQEEAGDSLEFQPKPPIEPELLRIHAECENYRCLLVDGGLLDQPYLLWRRVQLAGNTFHATLPLARKQAEIISDTNAKESLNMLQQHFGVGSEL